MWEGVCTASKANITYAAVHTPPSLRDTPSILEGEQVTALHRIGGMKKIKKIKKRSSTKSIKKFKFPSPILCSALR